MIKPLAEIKTSVVFTPARASTFFELEDPVAVCCPFRGGRHLIDPTFSRRAIGAFAFFMDGNTPYLYLSYNVLGNTTHAHRQLLRLYEPTLQDVHWLPIDIPLVLSPRSNGYTLSYTLAPSILSILWVLAGDWLKPRIAPGRWGGAFRVHSLTHHMLFVALSSTRQQPARH